MSSRGIVIPVAAMVLFACMVGLIGQSAFAQSREGGRIEGKVVDSQTGESLPMVGVRLEGTQRGACADLDGHYFIDKVPSGTYTVTFLMLGYTKVTVTEVKVTAGEVTTLNAALTTEAIEMKEVVVTARRIESSVAGLLASQKKAPAISDGIAAEQIARSPDSDAAAVVKRVTGLTVVDNKYVYVRGLGERYSNTLLNGSSLPSPEPNKRVVPLDILPANLLEKVVITKAFTPDQPGDFSGGSVRINVKEFPEALTVKFSASSSMNSQTTFRDFRTYSGGAWDFLGFNDGTRDIPALIQQKAENQKVFPKGRFARPEDPCFHTDELVELSKSFGNHWRARTIRAPVNQSYSFSIGNQNNLGGRPLGFLASLRYSNKYSFREEERNTYSAYKTGEGKRILQRLNHFDIEKSAFSVRWGGILNFSYKPTPKDKLSLKTLYTRNADDEVRTYDAEIRDYGDITRSVRFRYLSRSLLSSQLVGEHVLTFLGSRLDWRATFSRATNDEPDRRELLYDVSDAEHPRLLDEPKSGSRFYSELRDIERGSALDWTVPFKQWRGLSAKLKLGGGFNLKNRDYEVRRFQLARQQGSDPRLLTLPPDSLFLPENIGPHGFLVIERTNNVDNYTAEQTLVSGYGMIDMPLWRRLRLVTGARVERSRQWVETYDLFAPEKKPVIAHLDNVDILPAVNLTYSLSERMNLRTAFSQTVIRPYLRELSPMEFADFMDGVAKVGNPELKRTLIQNFDGRWEFYPHPGELIAVSAFYKNFIDPVEQTIGAGAHQLQIPVNAEDAHNFGIEFELRTSLDFLSASLAHFNVVGNLAFIRSEVGIGDSVVVRGVSTRQTSPQRSLQGQSPYVANAILGYQHPTLGTELSLLYNVFGRRIDSVGYETLPDIYEEARHSVDVTLSQLFGKFLIKCTAKNLLNSPHTFTQGGEICQRYKTGRSFSLGISYSI